MGIATDDLPIFVEKVICLVSGNNNTSEKCLTDKNNTDKYHLNHSGTIELCKVLAKKNAAGKSTLYKISRKNEKQIIIGSSISCLIITQSSRSSARTSAVMGQLDNNRSCRVQVELHKVIIEMNWKPGCRLDNSITTSSRDTLLDPKTNSGYGGQWCGIQ
uniref:Uncharacterized protein n=1 Tax=Romanomermis culicivorax TaxID=13658 RepID=A0A915JWG5_ROMCU